MKNYIISEFTKTRDLFDRILLDEKLQQNIINISQACIEALKRGKKIMFCRPTNLLIFDYLSS